MTSQVPKWLSFFKEAGIPASVASNYAIAFCDHRIQSDMLPDLTKEILRDMGVTVMGDIIATLRHAKQVHAQSEREKAAIALSLIEEQETNTLKKPTAASRMVDRWINNQRMSSGTSPVSGTESPKRSQVKKRLTIQASPSDYEPSPKKQTQSLSQRFNLQSSAQVTSTTKKNTGPKVPKISVQLPNDNKRPLAKQKQTVTLKQRPIATAVAKAKTPPKQLSVFDRLGEELSEPPKPDIYAVSSSTPTVKTQPALKPLKTSITAQRRVKPNAPVSVLLPSTPTSVFSRLGDLAQNSSAQPKVSVQPVLPSKRPQTITMSIPDDEDEDGIDYTSHSVLRPPIKKQTNRVKPVKPVKPVKRTVGVVSHTLSDGVSVSKSVFSRLGS